MVQIEPIEIFGNYGVLLKVYPTTHVYIWHVQILNNADCVIFARYVTGKTIEDVAQKLSLKLLNK